MSHDPKATLGHALHALHHTDAGKSAIHTIASATIAGGTAILTPIVGATAAPIVTVAAIGYALCRLFKK